MRDLKETVIFIDKFSRKSSEQEVQITIQELVDRFKDIEPIPGTYVVLRVKPKITKSTLVMSPGLDERPSDLKEWRLHTEENPSQAIVVAKGIPLLMGDGKEDPMICEPGDKVYLSMKSILGEVIMHNATIAYHIHQRNLVCKVK